MKSDTYFFKLENDYSDFEYTFTGNVSIEGGADVPYYQQVVPLNSAPEFDEEFPTRVSAEWGKAFNFSLPTVTDLDDDNWVVTLDNDEAPYVLYDAETHELYIKVNTTNVTDMGDKVITVLLTDDFPYGTKTTEYIFRLKIVEQGADTFIEKPFVPPPVQIVPEKKVFFSVSQ